MRMIDLLMVMWFNLSAQDDYISYTFDYLEKEYKIKYTENKSNVDFFIETESYDNIVDHVGFKITAEYGRNDFIEFLKKAKEKYKEWILTAQENDVRELEKPMELDGKTQYFQTYFLYGDEWHFTRKTKARPVFKVIDNEDTDYVLMILFRDLVSKSNQYIKCSSMALMFNSVEEIDYLIDNLHIRAFQEFKKQPSKEDLFK